MNTKLIGGILLIFGTTIGAGILALPVVTIHEGLLLSEFLLFGTWLLMLIGAFYIMEVTLLLPENSNMISMAKATLGKPGEIITWITYLLLLYALLCSYISGCSDFFGSMLSSVSFEFPQWISTILVTLLFGTIIYRGIRSVDLLNRVLMIAQIVICSFLILSILPHISGHYLKLNISKVPVSTIILMITSFGFAIIIPSLRTYFKSDVKKLKMALFVGSLLPLIFYALWIPVVQGLIPLDKLISLGTSDHVISGLSSELKHRTNTLWMTGVISAFSFICIVTSLLGVSLSMFDFLSDWLKFKKLGKQGVLLGLGVFIPPMIIVLLAPGIFIMALKYAGIFCAVLLMLLPALMVWKGRYKCKNLNSSGYQMFGGKILLVTYMIVSAILVIWAVVSSV